MQMTQVWENITNPGYCFYHFYAHIFKVLGAKFFTRREIKPLLTVLPMVYPLSRWLTHIRRCTSSFGLILMGFRLEISKLCMPVLEITINTTLNFRESRTIFVLWYRWCSIIYFILHSLYWPAHYLSNKLLNYLR